MRAAGEAMTEIHAADLAFVLDRLEALDDETGPLRAGLISRASASWATRSGVRRPRSSAGSIVAATPG